MVVRVMMDKMEKMMMIVTKTMHLVTSQVEVNMVGKVQRGCCCHCACKNLKSLITLDPVGSTMRYKVMKLFTGSVNDSNGWYLVELTQ